MQGLAWARAREEARGWGWSAGVLIAIPLLLTAIPVMPGGSEGSPSSASHSSLRKMLRSPWRPQHDKRGHEALEVEIK